jgi:hypothetical protein
MLILRIDSDFFLGYPRMLYYAISHYVEGCLERTWKEVVVTHLRQHPCNLMKGLKKTTKMSVTIRTQHLRTRNRTAGFGVLCTNE